MPVLTLEMPADYALVGIHSSEEDYRLAFLFNQVLKASFVLSKTSLDFKNKTVQFPIFEWENEADYCCQYLIGNKQITNTEQSDGYDLFSGNINTINYLIPEKKKIDFFLKIEGDICDKDLNDFVARINQIPQVVSAYLIDTNTIKSTKNLIF
ncbi:MAG: hypothetical protein COB98_10845 [Flavobacteriaceae bacterium]|nr:MAG: hypothetical protein COB98_10845 [Flavobacteriaceae bacterium]